MNSRDQYEITGLRKISHSIMQPFRSVCLKKALHKCIKVVETVQCLSLTKQKIEYFIQQQDFKIFKALPKFCLPDSQPAVRPGSTRCRPPDFSQVM